VVGGASGEATMTEASVPPEPEVKKTFLAVKFPTGRQSGAAPAQNDPGGGPAENAGLRVSKVSRRMEP
jgi:hypothetical protein